MSLCHLCDHYPQIRMCAGPNLLKSSIQITVVYMSDVSLDIQLKSIDYFKDLNETCHSFIIFCASTCYSLHWPRNTKYFAACNALTVLKVAHQHHNLYVAVTLSCHFFVSAKSQGQSCQYVPVYPLPVITTLFRGKKHLPFISSCVF